MCVKVFPSFKLGKTVLVPYYEVYLGVVIVGMLCGYPRGFCGYSAFFWVFVVIAGALIRCV